MTASLKNDIISILIPTRARPGLLACTVRMLHALADRPERIEILLYVDQDDPVNYDELWAKFAARGAPRVKGRIYVGPRTYYAGLYKAFNALAHIATGRWVFLWNDDIMMATKGWDTVLDGVPGEVAVAFTEANHGRSPCIFPAFTKTFTDIIGHVSMQTHNDTWIEEVGKGADVVVDVPILVLHAMVEDQLAIEGKANILDTSAAFYSDEMKMRRAADVKKIREYLAKVKR